MHLRHRLPALYLTALLVLPAARAADPGPAAPPPNVPQTLELGSIHVSGKIQVAQVLATIKQALKAPDSTDPKHRGDLVCRVVGELADGRTDLGGATKAAAA